MLHKWYDNVNRYIVFIHNLAVVYTNMIVNNICATKQQNHKILLSGI